MEHLLSLHVLASGSRGNAYLVEGPDGSLLIDDGLSRRELLRRAGELGVDVEAAAACVVTPEAVCALAGVRILALESNHDEAMLRSGPYPSYLKARVAGDHGHLSNAQAAAALPSLVTDDTEVVLAMHLSQENNRPSVAVRCLAQAVGAEPLDDLGVRAATADGRLRVLAAAQDAPMSVF